MTARRDQDDDGGRTAMQSGCWLGFAIVLAIAAPAVAAPAPPSNVTVADRPDDAGNALIVKWDLSPDDVPDKDARTVVKYDVLRRVADGDAPFVSVGESTYQKGLLVDDVEIEWDKEYLYQVVAIDAADARSEPATLAEPMKPTVQWFNSKRAWFGILLLIVAGSVVFFIEVARTGADLRIRKIAGLEAVDEAVGRATEMGKKVLFVPGIQDINDIQTVAGITILSRVATTVAEYDAELEVPTSRALVMTTARETVEASYLAAGRPDAYNEDDIYYLTDEQFGYVAGVTGTMVRDEPAACFYMGAFYAESLILAETGNSIGAIQIAGTAMPSQLPFFVAACDYTLIGEEFFAASAYLSGEPHQLGSLKGQDVGKGIGATLIVIGCVLLTILSILVYTSRKGDDAVRAEVEPEVSTMQRTASYIKDNILGEGGLFPK